MGKFSTVQTKEKEVQHGLKDDFDANFWTI